MNFIVDEKLQDTGTWQSTTKTALFYTGQMVERQRRQVSAGRFASSSVSRPYGHPGLTLADGSVRETTRNLNIFCVGA